MQVDFCPIFIHLEFNKTRSVGFYSTLVPVRVLPICRFRPDEGPLGSALVQYVGCYIVHMLWLGRVLARRRVWYVVIMSFQIASREWLFIN